MSERTEVGNPWRNNGRHPNCRRIKLTFDQCQRIRRQRAKGVSGAELARIYNVSRDHIYRICNNRLRVTE